MESFAKDSEEFKENLSKIPDEVLELFLRQFNSTPQLLRVGNLEIKGEKKKIKKENIEDTEEIINIDDDDENSY